MKFALVIIAFWIAVAALRCTMVFDRLPDPMASHFDAAGRPNGFMPRGAFFTVYALLGLLPTLPLLGMRGLRKTPPERLNIPNREYWLRPEHREQMYAKLTAWGAWFGAGLTTLLACMLELVLRANLTRTRLAMAPSWALIAGFMLYSLGCTVWLVRAFRIPDG